MDEATVVWVFKWSTNRPSSLFCLLLCWHPNNAVRRSWRKESTSWKLTPSNSLARRWSTTSTNWAHGRLVWVSTTNRTYRHPTTNNSFVPNSTTSNVWPVWNPTLKRYTNKTRQSNPTSFLTFSRKSKSLTFLKSLIRVNDGRSVLIISTRSLTSRCVDRAGYVFGKSSKILSLLGGVQFDSTLWSLLHQV